jgi:transcriptional regulator with XRE-family HTH domain
MKAHLGDKISELLQEKKLSVRQFAGLIGVTPNSVYEMLKKDLLHPKWVEVISDVLHYNLFQHVYEASEKYSNLKTDVEVEKLKKEIQYLLKQNEDLTKELSYLKEITQLLKKQSK